VSAVRLTQAEWARRGGARPDRVRIVHLGLGNFHRAHQAWYTAAAPDWRDWGIVAFSGRSPEQAELLAAQDGLYCVSVTGTHEDSVVVVPSILEAIDGARVDRLEGFLADPAVAIVTLTVTEAGYRLTAGGALDRADPVVVADLSLLRQAQEGAGLSGAGPESTLGRLLVGLDARRRAGEFPIAIVPCDNIPDNGPFLARGLTEFARAVSPALAAWIERNVAFVSTSVGRITPRVELPLESVVEAGWLDSASVATEQIADWILAGSFPAGRPAWDAVGARFVDDIEPWETRKLWLLNGAHSILAFAGLERGLETVAQAIADEECRDLVLAFWDEAVAHLPPDIEHVRYRAEVIERFSNRRIEHRLEQIASDATTKVRYRLVPIAERSIAQGADLEGSAGAIASWVRAMLSGVLPLDESPTLPAGDDPVRCLLEALSPRLATTPPFVAAVRARAGTVRAS
jgi:fructuronate reductase